MSSLYVHIPFCDHICSYCDFCKVFYKEDWAWQYLDALSFEINDKHLLSLYDTIYIGGGTPSSLSVEQLEKLFQILEPYSRDVKEYSIEVNPESMTKEKLELFVKYHINRVSIGVQSFDDQILKDIGRYHDSMMAKEWIEAFHHVGIDDINVDLIYGLPFQTLKNVYDDIDQAIALGVSHLSIYSLILEDHTVLKLNHYEPLSDEEDALWYESINSYLHKKGFHHYEVSNYYLGKPSLHNLVYWHYEDYDGIGLSAHSLKDHHRLENTNSLTQYLQHHYLKEDIPLTKEDEMFETLMMGLRLEEGVLISRMNQLFDIDFLKRYQKPIEKYIKYQMLRIEDDHIKTTPKGMNYLNTILLDFLE